MTKALGHIDTLLHWALDGYINAQRPGWGTLQLAQWHVCNAYENRADRAALELDESLAEVAP